MARGRRACVYCGREPSGALPHGWQVRRHLLKQKTSQRSTQRRSVLYVVCSKCMELVEPPEIVFVVHGTTKNRDSMGTRFRKAKHVDNDGQAQLGFGDG